MSSTIQNKAFFPIDNCLSQKELMKFPPWEDPFASIDYFHSERVVTLWERFLFGLSTGLDLQKIRRYRVDQYAFDKLECPPTMTKEEYQKKTMPIASQRGYFFCDLEAYWVDREISAHIMDIESLQEILKYHRLPSCRALDSRHDINAWGIENKHPIEWKLALGVESRIKLLYGHAKLFPSYNEESDTFFCVPEDKSIYARSSGVDNPNRILANWINISLTKRLEQDIERRKQDPHCRLLFAYNEIYEEQLKQRMKLANNVRWVAAALLFSLAGVVFFYYAKKES